MKKVLIVEDELITAKVLSKLISNNGFEVSGIIKNGEIVASVVKEKNPDLILMDIILQGEKDGISAMEDVRAFSNVPVIYITGYSDNATVERARKTDSSAFITKPYQTDFLVSVINKIFNNLIDKD